jgi:hypothetical protein
MLLLLMMMMTTTAMYAALVIYNYHNMTNFRTHSDNFILVRWGFLNTYEAFLSC